MAAFQFDGVGPVSVDILLLFLSIVALKLKSNRHAAIFSHQHLPPLLSTTPWPIIITALLGPIADLLALSGTLLTFNLRVSLVLWNLVIGAAALHELSTVYIPAKFHRWAQLIFLGLVVSFTFLYILDIASSIGVMLTWSSGFIYLYILGREMFGTPSVGGRMVAPGMSTMILFQEKLFVIVSFLVYFYILIVESEKQAVAIRSTLRWYLASGCVLIIESIVLFRAVFLGHSKIESNGEQIPTVGRYV